MAANNRPRSREKYITNDSKGVARRDSTPQSGRPQGGPSRGAMIGGGISLPVLLIMAVLYFLGGGSVDPSTTLYQTDSSNWTATSSARLDTTVAEGSRDKYTKLLGDGRDTITIMVYMCGTDLESRSGMATNDLKEMAAASLSDQVNLLIYTGGCAQWRNNTVSSQTNQIYKLENGGLRCLVPDDGAKAMTSPDTLTAFIKWSAAQYPADRYDLIFWDHGGGSISGYGYDEKFKNAGSMPLSGIAAALKGAGVLFDFIGFDACLMATAETALMLDDYGDYLIASEETEPGIGWYYTDWLTALSNDTSMPTTEIARHIIDDFTVACARAVSGQKTTLSVIDLAEFSHTVPDRLNGFAQNVRSLVSTDYSTVSNARYHAREFAQSSRIDQVDLVNLAENVASTEGNALANALKSAVKYNRTSANMTNAYGVSIYFPQQRKDYVEKAAGEYEYIGMDDDYTDCIRAFANTQAAGQTTTSAQDIMTVFNLLTSGRNAAPSTSEPTIQPDELVWQSNDGTATLSLSEDEWDSVLSLDLAMYYDDGSGYYDLGLDNVFDFDDDDRLIASTDRTWIAINGQPVAYYHTDTTEDGDDYTITGYVPVRLNGDRASLLLVFDNDNPRGYIAGAVYEEEEADTVAKNLTGLTPGDTLDFLCSYYSYDGDYKEEVLLGDAMTVTDDMQISNVDVGSGDVRILYRFTDIYSQHYWTESLKL